MKKKRLNLILLILIFVLIICCGVSVYFSYIKKEKASTKKMEDTIEEYDYHLYDSDSKEYKKLFYELKDILNASSINEEEYLKVISKMFAMDFYTLQNKISNDDIGGVEFVYSKVVDNFKSKAKDSVYLYLENYLNNKKKQQLPVVKDVLVDTMEVTPYTYLNTIDKKAYGVKIQIEYEKDLGYPTEATLYFIHDGKKLVLVEVA